MEKVLVGYEMSTRWSDPPILLMLMVPGLLGWIGVTVWLFFCSECYLWTPVPTLFISFVWTFIYHRPEPANTLQYVIFKDPALRKKYAGRKIPICEFVEHFIDGDICLHEGQDVLKTLQEDRYKFLTFKITVRQLRFLLEQFLPQTSSSFKSKSATKKEIADHYDRGNDFFNAFLGPSMVYTSGVFKGLPASSADLNLEQAQKNKMDMICDKLELKKGETFLDIGCGWGTLARHAAKRGAIATGVTLSVEGHKWCEQKAREEGLHKEGATRVPESAETLCKDYRDIPKDNSYNKIASIEMAEHVGVVNFQLYLNGVKELLDDDGMFLMQVAGLRQGSNWEDIAWGLFMSKYIFPGADASTPLNWYVKQCELAGFEVHSVETIGRHYSHTIHKWYDNWISNRKPMEEKYGFHLYRMWEIFLGWSVVASGQGTATCYQILMHKNLNDYPRDRWCTASGVSSSSNLGVGIGKTS